MPNMLHSDNFSKYLRDVETLAAASIPAPKEWVALRDRFTAYRQLDLPACDQLIAAVIKPTKGADVTTLHALALAETTNPGTQAKVDNRVAAAVERQLRELYRPAARSNYEQAAKQFDAAATAFTDAASLVDVEPRPPTCSTRPMTSAQHGRQPNSTPPESTPRCQYWSPRANSQASASTSKTAPC